MEDIKKHNNLKQCAIYAYHENNTLPPNYKCLETKHNTKTGFEACVISDGEQVIISFCGSNSFPDYINDISMGIKKLPAQTNDALNLYKKVKEEYPNSEIILTGHSLGGSLAQIVGAIKSYAGKKYSEMSKAEQNQFLEDSI